MDFSQTDFAKNSIGITASKCAEIVRLPVDQYFYPHSINISFKNSSKFIASIYSDYVGCEETWTYWFRK